MQPCSTQHCGCAARNTAGEGGGVCGQEGGGRGQGRGANLVQQPFDVCASIVHWLENECEDQCVIGRHALVAQQRQAVAGTQQNRLQDSTTCSSSSNVATLVHQAAAYNTAAPMRQLEPNTTTVNRRKQSDYRQTRRRHATKLWAKGESVPLEKSGRAPRGTRIVGQGSKGLTNLRKGPVLALVCDDFCSRRRRQSQLNKHMVPACNRTTSCRSGARHHERESTWTRSSGSDPARCWRAGPSGGSCP